MKTSCDDSEVCACVSFVLDFVSFDSEALNVASSVEP